MKAQRITFLALGGALAGAPTVGCSSRDVVPQEERPESDGPTMDARPASIASDATLTGPELHHGHVHEPGSTVIDLDDSGLPPLPTNLGDRVFDSIVRVDAHGKVQRKVVETTVEQRAQTQRMAKDLQELVRKSEGAPSAARLEQWRASWGLPTAAESMARLDDLMKMPFDVLLQSEMDDPVHVEVGNKGALQLEIVSETSPLAAQGYSYIGTTDNAGPSGGVCAPFLGTESTVIYWSQPNYQQHVLCIVGLYADNSGTHSAQYYHFTHSNYWTGGTDVDSYSMSVPWFGSRTSSGDTGTGVVGSGSGSMILDSDCNGDWIDNKVGSCINPYCTSACGW